MAAHWLTLDEIRARQAQHRSPLVLRCIEDWLAGRRYPLELLTPLRPMRWLLFLVLACLAVAARAETVRICYNYGCLAEAEAEFDEPQLAQRARVAGQRAERRGRAREAGGGDRLAARLGRPSRRRLPPTAAATTPTMGCVGGWTASTIRRRRRACLRLLEARGWLRFHRVLDPVLRVRFCSMHYSAQIEELPEVAGASDPRG
jgi:hypothetical protein